MGPRAGLDGVEKRKSFSGTGIWTLNRLAFSDSLLTTTLSWLPHMNNSETNSCRSYLTF